MSFLFVNGGFMYHRILLKLSGEALKDDNGSVIFSEKNFLAMRDAIKSLHDNGTQVGIVIGGGNIWRGKLAETLGLERVPADFMGMLGTVINCVSMASALRNKGVPARVFSALGDVAEGTAEAYDASKAIEAMENGEVVFFAGGIGKPYFSTDTAAATRALETKCEAILMAKHGVKGIYDKDPLKYHDAKFFKDITYQEVLDLKLGVMDLSAVELIKDTDLQIRVFSMQDASNVIKVCNGEDIGTTVRR